MTWAKKWFSFHVDWLEVVVDSATSGSKNGSSLLVPRGTLSGKILRWLAVVARTGGRSSWMLQKVAATAEWMRFTGTLPIALHGALSAALAAAVRSGMDAGLG